MSPTIAATLVLALAALLSPSEPTRLPDWGQHNWVLSVPGGGTHGCIGTGERQGCPRWVRDLCNADRKNKNIGYLKAQVAHRPETETTIRCDDGKPAATRQEG